MHTCGSIEPDSGMPKLIKGENITRLEPAELLSAVRLSAHGERGPKLQQLWLPKALLVCSQAPKDGHSPVLALCQQPVCVVQVRSMGLVGKNDTARTNFTLLLARYDRPRSFWTLTTSGPPIS